MLPVSRRMAKILPTRVKGRGSIHVMHKEVDWNDSFPLRFPGA